MSDFPIDYEADYVEPRSRLTTFFRLFTALPTGIWVSIVSIGVFFTVIAAWFALLFTGRYPSGLYNFHANFLKLVNRYDGYAYLATDDFPGFSLADDDSYPIRLRVAPQKAEYSRLHTFFRFITMIPSQIVAYVMGLVAFVGAVCAWFLIVFTGKTSEGLQNLINMGIAYSMKAAGYWLLLHEEWFPPISEDASPSGGALGSGGPPAQTPASTYSESSTPE